MNNGNGPPPPPHGENPKSSYGNASDLPSGNYDIFIIPPHSSGGGFIYLPSLQGQMPSFAAGVACTVAVFLVWKTVEPILKGWVNAVSQSGGSVGVFVMAALCGLAGWVYAKSADGKNPLGSTPGHSSPRGGSAGNSPRSGPSPNAKPQPQPQNSHSQPNFSQQNQNSSSSSAWEKAREETRRREEERRRADEAKKRAEDEVRRKADAERAAKAAAEKERWEKLRAREKETKEREEREKQARERMAKAKEEATRNSAKETAEREARLKAAKDRAESLRQDRAASAKAESNRAKSERAAPTFGVGERIHLYGTPNGAKSTVGADTKTKNAFHASAQSYVGTATENAFRPYDSPKHQRSAGSFHSVHSDESRGSEATNSAAGKPYATADETKVVIKGAFKFTDSFPKPVAVVRPSESGISDGLIMRMDTAGVFLDDDKKKEPLRQWDIKTWTMKCVEVSYCSLILGKSTNSCGPQPSQAYISSEYPYEMLKTQNSSTSSPTPNNGRFLMPSSDSRAVHKQKPYHSAP
jgi:hypothetical protein